MKIHRSLLFVLGFPFFLSVATAQTNATPAAANYPTAVPALIPFSGVAARTEGKPTGGETSITFLIYKEEQGGEPLFAETHTAAIDSAGHYAVQLGASLPAGLPLDIFASGDARWVEVQIAGEKPAPRILLLSVPYAVKAADAATLGGLPPSAFALARSSVSARSIAPEASAGLDSNVTTPGGTAGTVAVFTGASTVANSVLFQGMTANGTGVGIGITPNATLDVNGKAIVRGIFNLSRTGNATPSAGTNSYPFIFNSMAYSSAIQANVSPVFSLQGEATGNNTATPGATLNLLYNKNNGTGVETGLYFNPNGTIHFASGQTFPGTGAITGVIAGTALTGGGTSGKVTLNVDTTQVPLLAGSNTFKGTQSFTAGSLNITGGNLALPATTGANSGVVTIGGSPFLSGYTQSSQNVFVGGAGNFTTTGSQDSAMGTNALHAQTSGFSNTVIGWLSGQLVTSGYDNSAFGASSLSSATTASEDTALGWSSLVSATSGYRNTGVGVNALNHLTTGAYATGIGYNAAVGSGSPGIFNATAVGAFSTVSQDNSLVLGRTTEGNPGATFVNVGIGTDKPRSILEAAANAAGALGPALTLTNNGGGTGSAAAIDFNTYVPSTTGTYNPAVRISVADNGNFGGDLAFSSNKPGAANSGLQTNMVINADSGAVGIGTPPNLDLAARLAVYGGNNEDGLLVLGGSGVNRYGADGITGVGGSANGVSSAGIGGYFIGGSADDSSKEGVGLLAQSPDYVGLAGDFFGRVSITGSLYAEGKNFRIDHPLDPANKYLIHSSVESSEMMNIYSGNVTTDELGLATIKLPEWFEAENTDFRYQLTTIGRDAHAWIAKKVRAGSFQIATNATNVEVSWQITAVRQDAYAKANPMIVEQTKPDRERGFYLHPEFYGQAEEKQVAWGRYPQQMQRLKAQRSLARARENAARATSSIDRPAQPDGHRSRPSAIPAAASPERVAAVKH